MNRYSQRSLLSIVIGAMLVLGLTAPAVAREKKTEDGDRKEQQEERKAKARAHAEQQADDPGPQRHAERPRQAERSGETNRGPDRGVQQQSGNSQARRRDPAARPQVEDRGERIRGDDQQRLLMQQRHAREQAERRESLSRQRAERREEPRNERREETIRPNDDQRRVQQEKLQRERIEQRRQVERREVESRQRVENRDDTVQQRRDRQQRLSGQQQRRLIDEQRQRAQAYQQRIDAQQALARQRTYALQQQQRMAQYRYQQDYYQRMRQQQARWASQRYDYYNDPFFYTPANYRYSFGGQRYETNRYGADVLRNAVQAGYREGLRAGRADRMDDWRPDYRNAYAYQDANYGYNGYYVRQDAYNYYFRQGFRRGYDDSYRDDYRYGRYDNGSASILPTILSAILGLQLFN